VDGIETDLNSRLDVIRLDILSEFGRTTAGRFGVQAVPTLVLVDGTCRIIESYTGIPNRGTITGAARALLAGSPE
jgi:hypothetical protein